jgi:hypothetical protein
MFVIITKKRWKRIVEENRWMRETLARHDVLMRNLVRQLTRMEKDTKETSKENRALKAEMRKIKKQNNQR